jgi:hypothetical protein
MVSCDPEAQVGNVGETGHREVGCGHLGVMWSIQK